MSDDKPHADHERATADDYAHIFEGRVGGKILDDLTRRFARRKHSTGIDRILDTAEYNGQRNVLDFINNQINLANGVDDDADIKAQIDE